MRKKLHPRDRLWFLADPNLDQLIIKCEIILDGIIEKIHLENLVYEKLINKYYKFSWVIDENGNISISKKLDLSYHIDSTRDLTLDKNKPLWKFNLDNESINSKLNFHIHHCLVDGLSLVAILKDLSNNINEINIDTTKKSQPKRLSISIIFVVFFGILKTLLRIVFSKAIKIYGSDKKHGSKVWEKQLNNSDISEFELILEQVAKDKIAKKNLLIGIPVSLATNHKRIKNGLGNFFAFVPLTIKQNKHIYLDLKTIKKRGEIIGTYLVSLLIGLLPLKIGKHFAKFISSHIYGVVSGVFVSSHVLEILGVKVNRINAWAPILEGQKFSVTTVAYNNQITVNELERV